MAGKNLWEINYCDVTKLSVLQSRNLEKVQLVPFSLANGRKSHATHHKRELLMPFRNIYLASLKQLHCKGAPVVTFFFQSSKIVTLSIFLVIRENSFIFIYSVHHTPISTYIRSASLIIFCLLFIWEIWQIVLPMQLYFLFLPSLLKEHDFMCA